MLRASRGCLPYGARASAHAPQCLGAFSCVGPDTPRTFRWSLASPANSCFLQVDYRSKITQSFDMERRQFAAADGASSARTFCFLDEVERMQWCGLGKGGSLQNALVFDGGRLLNQEGFRSVQVSGFRF